MDEKHKSVKTALEMLTEARLLVSESEDSTDEQEHLLRQETDTTKKIVPQRVKELDAYVVPFEERDCPEHTFLVTIDELTGKAKDYTAIWKITCALLNAIGGILILKTADRWTEIDWIEWCQSCTDYMHNSMSRKTAASIHLKLVPSGMIMFIEKSQDLVLYNGCIITRAQSSNTQSSDLHFLVDILNRKSEALRHVHMDISYSFGDEFPHGRGNNSEYEHWLVTSGDIRSHIAKYQGAAKRFCQTLLAMANESCGGEVLFGLLGDAKRGKILIQGLHLEDDDREGFEDVIDEVLKNDPVTGEPRVWREPGRFPEKNTHWRVRYHDVINTPGNERRVIARIQIDHYPGGVFEVEPVAYDIDQNGFVVKKSFSEWREGLNKTSTITLTAGMKTGSMPKAVMRNTNQEKTVTRVDDGTSYVKAEDPQSMNAALKDRKQLSWTKDDINWSERLADSKVKVESYITSDSSFTMKNPLNFTPTKKTVKQYHLHSDALMKIQEIERYHESDQGFVICAKSWMSHLIEKMESPKGHRMDLLVFVQKCIDQDPKNPIKYHELHLWVISGTAGDQKDDWRYAIQTSLSLKQRLIKGGCPGISVICHTLHDDNSFDSSGHQEEIRKYLYSKSEETVELVKKTLSKILFQKDVHFTTTLGNQALINLTEEQAELLFKGDLRRITFIRGPPGSGKTILAQYIAKKYNPSKVIFICTTQSFQKYIVFSVNCKTYFAKSRAELMKWIKSEEIEGIECLIFDDVHNHQCTKDDWHAILEHLMLNQKVVHLFADPDIQDYKETGSTAGLQEAIQQIEKKYVIPTYSRELTEVHRNTRKVTSFIKDAAFANTHHGGDHIKASHSLNGDDIEMIYITGLRIKGPKNGLVILIQTLMTNNAEPGGFIYKACEIAVLLGGEDAYEDREFYRAVLRHQLDCTVHGADQNPKEGVQVDVVDEYVGLDAPVVIHLNSKPTPTTQMDNPKYRSFIASRGIFRVIFLVEEPLNYQHYKQMNLDRPLKCDAALIEHSDSANKTADDNQEAASAEDVNIALQVDDDLREAVSAGDVNKTLVLLKQGADVNGVGRDGNTALGLAALHSHFEVIKVLVSHGAVIELGEEKPLVEAAKGGHLDIIQWLIENGADVNVLSLGDTALSMAAWYGHVELVELLLSRGADTERGKLKPLISAAKEGHAACVKLLLLKGADVNGISQGKTALEQAAHEGYLEVMALLLFLRADPELGEVKPLVEAAHRGHIDCVKKLLQQGAKQETKNQALREALKAVQDHPEDLCGEEKDALVRIVETLRSHRAVAD